VTQHIEVVGAVIVYDDAVLVAQRGPTMSQAGLWEFPGGKVEAGETPELALVREIREELLCGVEVGDFVESTSHAYEFGTVRLTTYFARIVSGRPTPTEHAALLWVPVDELRELAWAPADVPAVARVMELLQQP